jgi:hypothetical protein
MDLWEKQRFGYAVGFSGRRNDQSQEGAAGLAARPQGQAADAGRAAKGP